MPRIGRRLLPKLKLVDKRIIGLMGGFIEGSVGDGDEDTGNVPVHTQTNGLGRPESFGRKLTFKPDTAIIEGGDGDQVGGRRQLGIVNWGL